MKLHHALICLAGAVFFAGCSLEPLGPGASGTGGSAGGGGAGGGVDPDTYLTAPPSCAYQCPNDSCSEQTTPYACPPLGAWAAVPHLAACQAWDGTYPASKPGQCTASAPTGAALARTGAVVGEPGVRVLPDGRPIKPAGSEWAFDETIQQGGSTTAVAALPGTRFVVTVDSGYDDHAVRVVDTTQIGAGNPVTGMVVFSAPSYLNAGIAALASGRVYVSTGFGVVQALDVDLQTGALTRNDAASLQLPIGSKGMPWYSSGVAVSPDGTRLVVSPVFDTKVFVFDVDPTSPTYQKQLGEVDLGQNETFGAWFDPHDPTGARAYVSLWGSLQVVEIDVSTATAPKITHTYATDQDPEGIAFLDARWMVVANDFGETISLIDRVAGTVTPVPIDFELGKHGLDSSGLAWDETNQRLYVTLAGIYALAAYDVDLSTVPLPTFTPVGRLPTSWWPSGVVVHADGSLTVVNLRGHPIGPIPVMNDSGGHTLMKGSVEQIPAPTAADLLGGQDQVDTSIAVGGQPGYPRVACPPGVSDFPVPATNVEGPSPVIEHVFFIVRENKTFDSLFGDLPGVDGDASIMMKATGAEMDQIWTNGRALARAFTVADNYYTLAVESTQGHFWATYGRTTDFCERTWSDNLRPLPFCGISGVGSPLEGSLFDWLQANNVVYDILGEIVGDPQVVPVHNPIDVRYPGGPVQNIPYNDIEKACYTAGRLRVACDLNTFLYMTLPNDHTLGVAPQNPAPDTMCSVNDEATGMMVDAISHSPWWASSLVVLTEDDPQAGGDHVDYHRTPLVFISPWVKRGYVSKTHIDVPSLHKIFAHVLGLPYQNVEVENAGLPFDVFTSTPDFTPYTYEPHQIPLACGGAATPPERALTESWDFRNADDQPGLGDQVWRWMRGRQLTELPPRLAAQIEERKARRARGVSVERRDDD